MSMLTVDHVDFSTMQISTDLNILKRCCTHFRN